MKTSGKSILALGLIVVALILWGAVIEPRFLLDVNHHEVEVPGLPAEWDGGVVAFLADTQVGMWLDNRRMVDRVVDEIIRARPDLVLIGGDFVYDPDSAAIDEVVSLFRPLTEAGLPVLAVLGNHDYSLMKKSAEPDRATAEALVTGLEAVGIDVLRNESTTVVRKGRTDPLYVAGIGSVWAGNAQPEKALAGIPPRVARLVLMHNPVAYRDLPPSSGALSVAGHTHGGQIRIPFLDSASWLDIALPREVVAEGWAAAHIGAPGNRLYVNRGIGFSSVPIRFLCPPELNFFTLRGARGDIPVRNRE